MFALIVIVGLFLPQYQILLPQCNTDNLAAYGLELWLAILDVYIYMKRCSAQLHMAWMNQKCYYWRLDYI